MKEPHYRKWDNIVDEKGEYNLPEKIVNTLTKKQYRIHKHSGVQICGWMKKSLMNKGDCYKKKFYGIDCHSCMEFSPAVMWCQENCSFCWRPMEFMKNVEIDENKVEDFKSLVDNLIEKRKELMSGFNVIHGADKEKLENAKTPTHFAISLSGEPTMYPHLDKIISYLKSMPKTKSIFLVTNAQIPEFFEKLIAEPKSVPTQLYISLESPTKELFQKISRPMFDDAWERLEKSLTIAKNVKTRKMIRFTQIKGLNDDEKYFKDYKRLFDLYEPDFIELKGYIHIGMSQGRHKKEDMPDFEEISNFSKKLCAFLGNYEFMDAIEISRICLLKRKNSKYKVSLKGGGFENGD